MKSLPLTVLILTLVTAVAADEPKIAAFLKSCEAAKVERIASLKNDLSELERLHGELKTVLDSYRRGTVNRRVTERTEVNGKFVFPTVQSKSASVEEAEQAFVASEKALSAQKEQVGKTIAAWEAGESLCLPFLPVTFQVGDIGMARGTVKSLQIIDDQNMLVVGPISDVRLKDRTVWLRGVSTKALADNDAVSINGDVFEVAGNKTYENALGTTKTVLVLEAFDMEAVKKVARAAREAKPVETRKWTSADGKFSVDAAFAGQIGGKVKLKKLDGKTVELEAAALSDADREWLANRGK